MAKKVVTSSEAIGEAPAAEPIVESTPAPVVEPVAGEPPVEAPAETPAPEPEPEPAKKPLLTIQVNAIQNITFGDGSEYKATFGVHDIYDERTANNLRDLLNRPNKRALFIL